MNADSFPRFAIASKFDARSWSGDGVFSMDGNIVTFPTYTDDEGVYLDVVQFLTGYGSVATATFESDFDAAITAVGKDPADFAVDINENDKITISIADPDIAVVLEASSDNTFWGFNAAGEGSSVAYGTDLTAGSDWYRGVIRNGYDENQPRLRFTLYENGVGLLGSFFVPSTAGWIQNPVCHIREIGQVGGRMDPNLTTFQDMLATQVDPDIRVCIESGKVTITSPVSVNPNIGWFDRQLQVRLGFSGNETFTLASDGAGSEFAHCRVLQADFELPGFINPVRPMIRQDAAHEQVSYALRLTDGSFASANVGSYKNWQLAFKLQGPVTNQDEHLHFLHRVLPYITLGEPVTYFQDWGDTREHLYYYEVYDQRPPYSIYYTTDQDGYRGAIVSRIRDNNAEELTVDWNAPFRQFTNEIVLDLAESQRGLP